MKRLTLLFASFGLLLLGAAALFFSGAFAPKEAKLTGAGSIPAGTVEPKEWAKVYPYHYESWAATKNPREAGKSVYKKGWDTDTVTYDKLSEFPYMPLLFNGFGFGIEYNEPRGHHFMRIDQDIVDPARVKAGGVCLNCKSPYMNDLEKKYGQGLYSMPWKEAIAKIPAEHKDLGVTCIDCHQSETMNLTTNRNAFTAGLAKLGKKEATRSEMRIQVCAQCHNTYNIPKDSAMKSVGVEHPWEGSKWGNIRIEAIIASIKAHPTWLEWKQNVTGFKLAFLRHPEFELFTCNSPHFQAGVSCADCHMPYKKTGGTKMSDHDVKSPLKDDLKACQKCHPDGKERLRNTVLEIQHSTASLLNRAGYACATTAKLFEMANKETAAGRVIDSTLYLKAKELYIEALYRTIYIGAENSMGFHHPSEAARNLGDGAALAGKAEALLRQMLAQAGVRVPAEIPLELSKYLKDRGTHKLNFRPEQELPDPLKVQEKLQSRASAGL